MRKKQFKPSTNSMLFLQVFRLGTGFHQVQKKQAITKTTITKPSTPVHQDIMWWTGLTEPPEVGEWGYP